MKPRRSVVVGPPGMCCAPSFIRASSWPPTRCSLVGRPKLTRPLPKALPRGAVAALLETVAQDVDPKRQTDWAERDLAIILTALLAGLRADELRQAEIADIRTTDDGAAIIHVKGKGRKRTQRPHRNRVAVRHRGVPREPRKSVPWRYKAQNRPSGLRRGAMARAITAVRRPRRGTNYPWNTAITNQTCLQTRRARRAAGSRCSSSRTSSHLRDRTRQFRRQRVHADEVAWPRINDYLATLRYRRGH
jgi:integrase